MKFSASLLALVAGASAHTMMSELYIDGVAQGDATCIRTPKSAELAVSPIEDLTSNNMACGLDGEKGVARVCSVNGGQTLTFEFREWPDVASKGAFDIGHYGPCAVYAKKVDDPTTDGAVGDGWFKIWHEGYDESASKWCTTKVLDNGGRLSIEVPDALQSGYYLIRSELLALHNANLSPPDPQFYVSCAQVYLRTTGSVSPSSTVSIPGYVSISEKSVTYDIYAKPLALPYPNVGPAPIDTSSSGSSGSVSSVAQQTIGLDPGNCIAHNGNWCGVEVEKYTSESAGWAQSKICWTQTQACFASAPPTGAAGCTLMETKCNNIDDELNGGTFSGPPNWGKVLDPKAVTISIPAAVNAGLVGVAGTLAPAASSAVASSAVASSAAASSGSANASSAASSAVESSASAAATYSDVEDNSYAAATSAVASVSTAVAAATSLNAASSRVRKHRVKPTSAAYGDSEDDDSEDDDSSDATPTTFVTSAARATDAAKTVTESECDLTTVDVTVYATATAADYEKREAQHYGHRRARRAAN
jgi:hypothetical protein